MKCPICKNNDHVDFDLHSGSFVENIMECSVCGSIWSVNHGSSKIVMDTQEDSFLKGADTYSFAA
jgi:uncharacterized Zn finger protein